MEKDQIFKHAQNMFLNGAGRKAVMDYMAENGIPEEEIGDLTTKAYQSVREQVVQMKMEAVEGPSGVGGESSGSGIANIVIGVLILFGGIFATMNSDSLWYGAILVGAVSIISGIAKMAR